MPDKDVIITAYPEKNWAIVQGCTPDALILLRREYRLEAFRELKLFGQDINGFLDLLRSKNLTFSFRRGGQGFEVETVCDGDNGTETTGRED